MVGPWRAWRQDGGERRTVAPEHVHEGPYADARKELRSMTIETGTEPLCLQRISIIPLGRKPKFKLKLESSRSVCAKLV